MDFPLFKEIQFNRELNLRSGSNTATEREGAFNASISRRTQDVRMTMRNRIKGIKGVKVF